MRSINSYLRVIVASVITALVAVAVAACGGSHSVRGSGGSNVAAVAATHRQAVTGGVPLSGRVLPPRSLPGFVSMQYPTIVRSPALWATTVEKSSTPAGETQRLRELGFVSGIDEHLFGRYPVTADALSLAEQYRSSASARAELVYQYTQARSSARTSGGTFTPFSVTGLPGARGWEASSGNSVGLNVIFASGPFYYVVGAGFPRHAPFAPTRARITAAANFLDLLVNGCVAHTGTGKVPAALASQRMGRS
jgi:hypothetical protein